MVNFMPYEPEFIVKVKHYRYLCATNSCCRKSQNIVLDMNRKPVPYIFLQGTMPKSSRSEQWHQMAAHSTSMSSLRIRFQEKHLSSTTSPCHKVSSTTGGHQSSHPASKTVLTASLVGSKPCSCNTHPIWRHTTALDSTAGSC